MFFRSAAQALHPAPDTCPGPLSLAPVPSTCPAPQAHAAAPPRARTKASKPAQVFRLYPEPVATDASAQARIFLKILRETIDVSGCWLIVGDLSRCYGEIARQEGWTVLRWAEIGRELAKLTKRKTIKRQGKRHVAYLLK